MDGNIAEKHMEQSAAFSRSITARIRAASAIRNLPRASRSLFRSTRQKSSRRSLDDFDAIDRPVSFALLRNDNGPKGSQADDVPVDVQHFWLEKCRAKQRDRRRSWLPFAPALKCARQGIPHPQGNSPFHAGYDQPSGMKRCAGTEVFGHHSLAAAIVGWRGRIHSLPWLFCKDLLHDAFNGRPLLGRFDRDNLAAFFYWGDKLLRRKRAGE